MDLKDTAVAPGSPFHEGEQRVQRALGVREEIEPWARKVVRPFLPEPHRAFYGGLPFVVMAARDRGGRPWVTILAGTEGLLSSPDASTLRVAALPGAGDALEGALREGADVGLLGIEPWSLRRNRVNGRARRVGEDGFELAVDQSFGNCPQHITERGWRRAVAAAPPRARRGTLLEGAQRERIGRADTFFVATGYHPGDPRSEASAEPGGVAIAGRESETFGESESETFGMDASHRGGAPGFVRVDGGRRLVFPDYAGNNHFNTIGNLVLDPRIGLLFVEFESGDLLQLTGTARIDWESREIARFPGAQRLVRVEIEEVIELPGALPLRFEIEGEALRELRVVGKERESDDVTSFTFEARDGGPLPAFMAGQHLPIELKGPQQADPLLRTYSLSGPPGDPRYRITVKREPRGRASRQLHEEVDVGDIVSARAPRGSFVLDASSTRPVVLVSAGVGLTPLVSMLHALASEAGGPVWFVHGARDGRHHPLAREIARLAEGSRDLRLHVAYSRPRAEDRGRHQSEGRVDGALLEKLVPGLEADFYLCGPTGFMAAIQGDLEERGVGLERIRSESFGPASRPTS